MADGEDISVRDRINSLAKETENDYCADCGEKGLQIADMGARARTAFTNDIDADPDWVSTNLGVFLCISCAGIHRRMSVSVSRVRSIRLDSWTNDMVEVS